MTCQTCHAGTPDGITLCETDAETLLEAVYAVPAIVDDLHTMFARADNMRGPGRMVGKSTETPLPWNPRAVRQLDALTEVLCRYARPVARERQLTTMPVIPHTRDPKDPARVTGAAGLAVLAARILGDHWSTVRSLRYAGDAHEEITDAVHSARRSIDRPADRRFLGVCSFTLDDGTECDRDLYGHPSRNVVKCPSCGCEHDVAYRQETMLAAVQDQRVTYHEAERALSGLLGRAVKVSTLRNWVHERRLIPEGYRHAGTYSPTRVGYHDAPLLRVGDIVDEYVRVAQQAAS